MDLVLARLPAPATSASLAIFVVFVGLMLSAVSCKHTSSTASLHKAEYGAPGPGKIRVTVQGDVANPGKYWIPQATTLAAMKRILGNPGHPRQLSVTLVRRSAGAREMRSTWKMDQLPKGTAAVTLRNGDVLSYSDTTPYIPVARCAKSDVARAQAALSSAGIACRLTVILGNSRMVSVRSDQRKTARKWLKKDAQAYHYTIEFY